MNAAKELIKPYVPEFLKEQYRTFKKQTESEIYKGDKVLCPICGSKFREFIPAGLVKRLNARCPNCNSLERHRLIWKYAQEKTNLFNNQKKRLLHFAPERMLYEAFSKNSFIEYYPADLFPKKYRYVGKIKVQKADITNIPYTDDNFDVILCCHVLEHIPDDKLALSELYRVMNVNGWGIFQVPIDSHRINTYEDFSITDPKERERAFGQNDHVRKYGKDFADRLKSVGFKVTVIDYANHHTEHELFKFGLLREDMIYLCEK